MPQPSVKGIKCVLFDLDNTLIGIPNTYTYFDKLIQFVMEKDFALPIPPKTERDSLWRSGHKYIAILQRWGISEPAQFWENFDGRDAENRADMVHDRKLVLYPDVIPVLSKLQKLTIPMGIVTNTPLFIASLEVDAYGLTPFFSVIVGLGDNQENCKPEPYGILRAIDQVGVAAEQTLYVGDSSIDVEAAQRARVHPIRIDRQEAASRKFHPEHPRGVVFISDLSEMFSLYRF